MKNLKLLLLVCVVLIIALLIIKSTLTKEEAPPAPETSKPGNVNVDEVYNQGGEVLEYDGYTYYVNTMERNGEFSNKVCRKAIGYGGI